MFVDRDGNLMAFSPKPAEEGVSAQDRSSRNLMSQNATSTCRTPSWAKSISFESPIRYNHYAIRNRTNERVCHVYSC